jgi:hypothetical protein
LAHLLVRVRVKVRVRALTAAPAPPVSRVLPEIQVIGVYTPSGVGRRICVAM